MTRLEKVFDDSDSTLNRRACDSDSRKMNWAHHWIFVLEMRSHGICFVFSVNFPQVLNSQFIYELFFTLLYTLKYGSILRFLVCHPV